MFTHELSTGGDNSGFRVSILKFDDDIQIIADPVWDGENPQDLLSLENVLRNTQLILLSHSTPEFLSGYALLCNKFPSLLANIPVYSTVAVSQLGRVSTVEFYRSKGYLGPLETAFLEISDVDEYFDKIILIKYYQNVSVLDNRILLSAYNAGHTLGGTFWLIVRKSERIIYAPSWNMSKDTFLNGAAFISASNGNALPSLARPTALITGGTIGSPLSHRKRVEKFLNLVDATLANGGAVLLPTNISGRFLELLHIVDTHLSGLQGAAIPVYFLSYSGTKVLGYASNLADWMSSLALKDLDGGSDFDHVPLDPSKVDLLLDPLELVQLPGPKVVFASGIDFAGGEQSSQALQLLCLDEKTTIVMTEKPSLLLQNSLAADLFLQWSNTAMAQTGTTEDGIPVPLERSISSDHFVEEQKLREPDLSAFRNEINKRRKEKEIERIKDKKARNLLNASLSSDESDDDEEVSSDEEVEESENNEEGAKPIIPNKREIGPINAHEAYVTEYVVESLDLSKPVDIRITSKFRSRQAMFPSRNIKKRKNDDYGEVIDTKEFQRSEENTQNSKLINQSKRNFEALAGDRHFGNQKRSNDEASKVENKLTPQQLLNNQILQKYLDTLFRPVKRQIAHDVRIRCGLSFVDLAGDVDIRSFNLIVSSVRPTNLIVLPDFTYREAFGKERNGVSSIQKSINQFRKERQKEFESSEESSRQLRSNAVLQKHLQRTFTSSEMSLSIAEYNSPVSVMGRGQGGSGSDFVLHIDEDLWKTIRWKRLDGNYKLAHVDGLLDSSKKSLQANLSTESQIQLRPLSSGVDLSRGPKDHLMTTAPKLTKLAVGNIRLPELKRKLKELNMRAEFKGEGTLMVDDQVAIKKINVFSGSNDEAGDIVIEGQMGLLFYKIKRCVKDMLAYV